MRELAAFAFETAKNDSSDPQYLDDVASLVNAWLASKGTLAPDGDILYLRGDRKARIERRDTVATKGRLLGWALTEPTPNGWFRTLVSVAEDTNRTAVHIQLAAGATALAPMYLDVHCPRLVREILALPTSWSYRGTRLSSTPLEFSGRDGGDRFILLAWDQARAIPVVAVSDEYGSVLHPGIIEDLASDLAGLALVARLDPEASLRITRRKEKEWSCYGGAIRLYWPNLASDSSPFHHSLWTPRRLLSGVADTEVAAARLRQQLRRRILGQSAFAVTPSPLFYSISRAAREESLTAIRQGAESDKDYKKIADEFFAELVKANEELQQRYDEITDLKAKVSSLQLAVQWRDTDGEVVEPDSEAPPESVEDAVIMATERFSDSLLFGPTVYESIYSLAPDAGPPDKILSYLHTLSELAIAKRSGSLGKTTVGWLEERGVIASGESATIRNSPKEQEARTWETGRGSATTFDLHLKPSEATSPDRCVRIYFDYDEEARKVIVGYLGRHL